MGEFDHNRLPDDQLASWRSRLRDFSEGEAVDPVKLTELHEQFLASIHQAQGRTQPRQVPMALRRWALAGALLIALVVLGPLFMPDHTALNAARYPGLQGQVVSAQDLLPLSGVQVCILRGNTALQHVQAGTTAETTPAQTATLIDITDPAGFFDVPPQDLDTDCLMTFNYHGEQLAKLDIVPGQRDFVGFQRVVVRNEKLCSDKEYPVTLEPGGVCEPKPGVTVRLAAEARSSWTGTLSYNRKYPGAFSYACVLDGIYQLQGPATSALSLEVAVDPVSLQHYQAKLDQVDLLVFNEQYLKGDDYSGFHRGWYVGNHPLANCALPEIALKHSSGANGPTVSWQAEPGVEYALKVPMQVSGEIVMAHVFPNAASDPQTSYECLMLLNQPQPQLYLVEAHYTDPQIGEDIVLTDQPRLHQPFYEMQYTPQGVAAAAAGSEYQPLGKWTLDLEDFTLTEHHRFSVTVDQDLPQPGHYRLELEPGQVGGKSIARVTGDLQRLASQVEWDLGYDYVVDAYGEECEIAEPYAGTYLVTAIMREKNGAVTVLQDKLHVVDSSAPLFYETYFNAVPVLDCQAQPPAVDQELFILSPGAIANPLPYGYSMSGGVGPVWRCDLPPEFLDKPLKKVRIVMYASPVGGDVTNISFQPQLWLMPKTQPGPMVQGMTSWELPGGEFLEVGNEGLSHVARYTLRAANAGEDVRKFLTDGWFYEKSVKGIRENLELKLGWDLRDLPPADEIIRTFQWFIDSPAFGRRFVIEPHQRLEWEFNLLGNQVHADQQLLLHTNIETQGLVVQAQWLLHNGAGQSACIEIEAEGVDHPWRGYIDLGSLSTD